MNPPDGTDAIPRTDASILGRPFVLTAALVVLSAIASFVTVRAWRSPVRAASSAAPARLTIETEPAGAELFVDNEPRGITPQTLSLDPGEHAVVVRAGGADRTMRVQLAPGAFQVHHVELPPPSTRTGRVSIVTDPPGARVSIDGNARGVSPLVVDDLSAADHVVAVDGETGSARRTITVAGGALHEMVFSLTPSPASSASSASAPVGGWVVVSSPFPVDLIERDELVGTSGAAKVMLAAGRHSINLRNEGLGYMASRVVEVAPGRVVHVTVSPPQARANINARPWADVTIDGTPAGQTPLANVSLPIGPHEITFRHPQLGQRTERVAIAANRENRISVDFTK